MAVTISDFIRVATVIKAAGVKICCTKKHFVKILP